MLDWSLSPPSLMTPSEPWAWTGPAATASAATSVAIPSIFIAGSFLDREILVDLVHVGVGLRVDDGVDDAPMLHDVMPVGHGGREPEILLDEEDREPLRLQAPDGGADLLDDHRGQALRRLVQQQQARARAENARDGQHLLLAARELGALAAPALAEVGEQRVDGLDGQATRPYVGGQHEIFLDVEAGEDAALFRAEVDAEPGDVIGGPRGQLVALGAHRATAPADDAHDRLQGRRLAGAVAAEQRYHLARAHVEGDAVQDVRLAIPRVQIAHGQERRALRHGPSPCTPRPPRDGARRSRNRPRPAPRRAPGP